MLVGAFGASRLATIVACFFGLGAQENGILVKRWGKDAKKDDVLYDWKWH